MTTSEQKQQNNFEKWSIWLLLVWPVYIILTGVALWGIFRNNLNWPFMVFAVLILLAALSVLSLPFKTTVSDGRLTVYRLYGKRTVDLRHLTSIKRKTNIPSAFLNWHKTNPPYIGDILKLTTDDSRVTVPIGFMGNKGKDGSNLINLINTYNQGRPWQN